jgi:hypothetical protein
MFKLLQQKGSSTVGLLTATAIFIGLLVYANQFAFNNNDNSLLSSLFNKSPDPVTTESVEVLASPDTDTIQPSPQGIFETPTLSPEDSNEVANASEALRHEQDNSESSVNAELSAPRLIAQSQPYPQAVVIPVNYASGNWNSDQVAATFYNNQYTGFNNNQQYRSTSRANGRGNGRGKMNGDGDFNFSMKFKARGRLDANSELDSNLTAYGNAYQQNLYNLNAQSSPAYSYTYYRY